MNRVMRYVLVGMLVTTLAVDSVAARRLFKRCCRPKCCVACPVPCESACKTVSFDDSAVHLSTLDCGGEIVHDVTPLVLDCQGCSSSSWPAETTDEHLPTESAPTAPLPSEPTPASEAEQAEPEETIPAPNATDQPAAHSTDPQAVLPPAPIAVPEETATVESTPSTPAPEQPAPSVVGDRYSSQSADGGIFGTPTPTESTPSPTTPASAQPTDDTTDIFGEPTATANTPAADETSLPAPSQSTSEQPADASAPAEQSPTDDSGLDDLFGPSDSSPQTDEEEEEQPADESPQPSPTPQPSTPEPAAPTPAEPQLDESDDAEADTPESDKPGDDAEEPYDPFGEGFSLRDEHTSTLLADGGLRSDAYRTWTDNSGSFQCQARLQCVTSGGVVLMRLNGKQLNVPFARLADDDLQFVHQQVTALRVVRARDAAAQKLAVTWSR